MISAALNKQGDVLRDDMPDALFPWWSFTKPVLATLILQAVEIGKLDLDAPFDGHPFTLLQILQQRAGLPDYGPLPSYKAAVQAGETPWPAERLLRETGYPETIYDPGTRWLYSNLGYLLLCQTLERVHDTPLADIMQTQICSPLGLAARVAMTAKDFAEVHWDNVNGYHPGWVYHGCLMGTALDAARLLQAILGRDLLTEPSRQLLLTQQMQSGPIPGRVWSEIGYGLGIMIGAAGDAGRIIGHSGCGPFCANLVAHFPDHPDQVTVASFVKGGNEAPAEHGAVAVAKQHRVNTA